jgi:diphosphomevalonate decarboxylase
MAQYSPRVSGIGQEAVAKACANVALVKYWGKRDAIANLPAVGSISLTLAGLEAIARVGPGRPARFSSAGEGIGGTAGARMTGFLDWLSNAYGDGIELSADIEANFPVAAGLASSAAIYCAVATAALSSVGARVSRCELSGIARRGSGSAARSVFGGLVEWHRGERTDGTDSHAEPLLGPAEWDIGMAVAVLDEGKKKTSSRDAMEHVAATSPLYTAWVDAQDPDLVAMRAAIAARDLAAVGRITEENTLRMHAITLAARPPVIYWQPATLRVMHAVHAMREDGIPAFFTMDAGPQVKVLTAGSELAMVCERLAALPGVVRVLQARPGKGVEMVQGEAPWR